MHHRCNLKGGIQTRGDGTGDQGAGVSRHGFRPLTRIGQAFRPWFRQVQTGSRGEANLPDSLNACPTSPEFSLSTVRRLPEPGPNLSRTPGDPHTKRPEMQLQTRGRGRRESDVTRGTGRGSRLSVVGRGRYTTHMGGGRRERRSVKVERHEPKVERHERLQ